MPQRKGRRVRTGPATTAGVFALVFTGVGFTGTGTASAQARECPAGTGPVSTLTGVICSTTGALTGAGRQIVDAGTGGALSPLTGTAERAADGLVGGAHAAATRAEGRGRDGGERGGGDKDRKGGDKGDKKGKDGAGRDSGPSWTFPGGFTPRERMRYLDSRYPAPAYSTLPPGLFNGRTGGGAPLAEPPRIAPGQPQPLSAWPALDNAVAVPIGNETGQPPAFAVAGAAGAAGLVIALHLGLVDRRRDSRPRRHPGQANSG